MNAPEFGKRELHHHRSYFETMYTTNSDPWGFDTRWYERRKYDLTMALLPNRHYRHAVEPGCANGALTQRLARRCDRVTAFDFVEATVQRARDRLSEVSNVHLEIGEFPSYWPQDTGDLVVWSEVAYYLKAAGRDCAEAGLKRWLEPGGHLISVHYTGETDYPMSGTQVETWIDTIGWLAPISLLRDVGFSARVWSRLDNS